MRKRFMLLTLVGLVICILAASLALAAKIPSSPAGKSSTAHLYLYQKDPGTWQIVPGGAWGKMTYRIIAPAFRFVFNGHKLQPGMAYTLIYYPDPWPGNNLICLGSGIANEEGNVHIAGAVQTGDLPQPGDANVLNGAKIWLVLSTDVDCIGPPPHMIGWNPTQYLFEHNLISFRQTPS